MNRDHEEVARLTQELASLRFQLSGATLRVLKLRSFGRVLYGLHALIAVHFAKEEETCLPLLDARLTPEEARQMFQATDKAER